MVRIKTTFLRNIYIVAFFTFLSLIIITPRIVKSGISFIEEEYLEGLIISVLFISGHIIMRLYIGEVNRINKNLLKIQQEKRSAEDKLNDVFKYIGGVNVQINAIRSVLSGMEKYPEDKKEMKQVMRLLADTVLKIVPADWVLLRILDTQSIKTLREMSQSRGSSVLIKHEISNKDLIKKKDDDDYIAISPSQSNMTIQVFCILPRIKLSEEQEVMLKAIVNQLEMLFIIFNSQYYKS